MPPPNGLSQVECHRAFFKSKAPDGERQIWQRDGLGIPTDKQVWVLGVTLNHTPINTIDDQMDDEDIRSRRSDRSRAIPQGDLRERGNIRILSAHSGGGGVGEGASASLLMDEAATRLSTSRSQHAVIAGRTRVGRATQFAWACRLRYGDSPPRDRIFGSDGGRWGGSRAESLADCIFWSGRAGQSKDRARRRRFRWRNGGEIWLD